MINSKIICNNLLSDSRITQLIDEDNILDTYPNEVEIFPCIIYLDGNQNDTEFADNLPTATSFSVDIHIFTKAVEGFPTTSQIGIIVGDVFKENFFTCVGNIEVADDNQEVRHRVMSFRKEILS